MLSGAGFVDTGASIGPAVYSNAGQSMVSQYAAMPSLHVGWALVVGGRRKDDEDHRRAQGHGEGRPTDFRRTWTESGQTPILSAIV
jgi:hypothetical protein